MKKPKTKIDRVTIASATSKASRLLESALKCAEMIKNDVDKKERISSCKCPACWYLNSSRVGCNVVTDRECSICGKVEIYPSSLTDPLCIVCARSNDLCKQCGGDINLTGNRRKPRPYEEN